MEWRIKRNTADVSKIEEAGFGGMVFSSIFILFVLPLLFFCFEREITR